MTRKLYGMVLAAALIIVPMLAVSFHAANSNSGAAIADDAKPKEGAAKPDQDKPADNSAAKPAENMPKAQDASPKPEQKSEVMPSALPTDESPIAAGDPIWMSYQGNPCVEITVIVNGSQKTMLINGDPEKTVTFRLRTDEWKHVSVQFFGKHKFSDDIFASAVVLVPDEECLAAWTKWYPKACEEARHRAHPCYYPSRVLPPN